jgi:Amt family ammonium transporter
LVNGVFGTLAVGLFGVEGLGGLPKSGLFTGGGAEQLIIQLKGVLAAGGFTFAASLALWYVLKLTLGARVSPEDEIVGLDISEIGMEAYPEAKDIEAKVRESGITAATAVSAAE